MWRMISFVRRGDLHKRLLEIGEEVGVTGVLPLQ